MTNDTKLSESEIQNVADLLARFEPGFVPYPVFAQLARIMALPIVEFVPLRFQGGVVEVLLIERPPEDTYFAGMLHTPGTVIRATDVGKGGGKNWTAFERILQDELHGTSVSDPYYVGSIFHASKRGAEQAQLYWVEALDEPRVGNFYSVNDLPDNLIESQRDFIQEAARSFETFRSTQR